MKAARQIRKVIAGFLGLALILGAWLPPVMVQAASGTVYTCVIHPCYAHPVTGEIEDSGGEASYATGQGMVDGAVYTTGILEAADTGEYYLTIRLSLMDYTSGHSFWVQNVGDSGWATPAMGVTGNGSDSNGTTADVCIQVPSENCVVRGSMYVNPMGRDVIFYLYPSDYTQGNNTDMNATMVTEASGSSVQSSGGTTYSSDTGTTASESTGTDSSASELQSQAPQETAATATPTPAPTAAASESEAADTEQQGSTELKSSIESAATPAAEPKTDETLNDAQGLSLSTAEEGAETVQAEGSDKGSTAFAVGAAVTLSGLILMGAASGIVYFFRRNWRRWGGGEDDDE